MRLNLKKDPYNLIITGVGGQGNVLCSQIVGAALIRRVFQVTIGETYGLSQRGGAVMSQIRIYRRERVGPMIPAGRADLIVGLEPLEVLRTLSVYGNPDVQILTNNRPIYPINVLSGDALYPDLSRIKENLGLFSKKFWWLPASDMALEMGNPILANMVLLGALAGIRVLPVDQADFKKVIETRWAEEQAAQNLQAFALGFKWIAKNKLEHK